MQSFPNNSFHAAQLDLSHWKNPQVIKAKKRRLGRAQKTIGDYCLLAGSPVDANAHYSTALELTRLTADFFWYAGAMEGSVCALLVSFQLFFKKTWILVRYGNLFIFYCCFSPSECLQRLF